jgi:hypothetical protein
MRILVAFIFTFVLGGCANLSSISPASQQQESSPLSERYLRGVFNWWEANDSFRFIEGIDGWHVDVDLIADGQPYDFKVSDAQWYPSNTCGGGSSVLPLSVGEEVFLSCGVGVENVRFTPAKTGVYRFTIDRASRNDLRLLVVPVLK